MPNKPPAFQLYAAAWLVDTTRLTLEEQGAYMRLLCHQWINGSLHADDFPRLLGLPTELAQSLGQRLTHFFPSDGNGGFANLRLERTRQDLEAHRARVSGALVVARSKIGTKSVPEPVSVASLSLPVVGTTTPNLETTSEPGLKIATADAVTRRPPRGADVIAELKALHEKAQRLERNRESGVKLVFAYWVAKWGRTTAWLDDKRKNRLRARLKENHDDVSELLYVVDGSKRDDWADRPKYVGVDQLFRDRDVVERLASLCPDYRAGKPHTYALRYGMTDV